MSQISQIKKIYHAAIYVRLSKEDGAVASHEKAESNSIANQKSLIREFLKSKNDIVIEQEYVDDGFSGSNFERPAFQMMLEDIKKGKIDCVVIDNNPAKSFVAANEGLKILDTEYAVEDYAICLPKNSPLTEKINTALAELTADGTIQKIIDKYISAE